jgi:hypothetical protein
MRSDNELCVVGTNSAFRTAVLLKDSGSLIWGYEMMWHPTKKERKNTLKNWDLGGL